MEKKKSGALDKIVTIILTLVIVVLALATLYQMFYATEDVDRSASTESDIVIVNISASEAEIKEFIQTTRFQGEVTTEEANISVIPETSGTLKSIQVRKGDKVEEGETIAFVDPSRPGSQYELSPVVAKISGTVISLDATPGSAVSSSSSIVTLMPEKTLYVATDIPERYVSTLSIGLDGTVTSVAYANKSYPVEVSYISPMLDSTSRTLPVELTFTTSSDGIMEGMYVSVDLVTERIEEALVVPSSAVSSYAGRSIVYIIENGTALRRTVETGSSNTTETVILSGISAGDVVVTAGNVTDGTLVSIV